MRKILAGLLGVMMAISSLAAAAETKASKDWPDGWTFPYLGAGKGSWDASVGLFFWQDTFKARNLQLRTDVDLAPGVRWHGIVRSNREFDTLQGLKPHFDENYVEGYGFYHNQDGTLSTSLRVGNVRYLHFPYPDAIAVFDQVPGISDLKGGTRTGYSGEILTLDYGHKSGFGVHFTGINWGFGREGDSGAIENYVYYRNNFGKLHFESRYGKLELRAEPLGNSETGYNLYAGTQIGALQAGLLYEKLHNQTAYTGVMVSFPLNPVTKAMGQVAFDYDRTPQGFAMQVPVAKGTMGGIVKKAPVKGILVGEIQAERLRTYWQNGQARNYYEHRISQWGQTGGSGLVVVMQEDPWYLQAEALVSPHNFSNAKTWEKDRQGPAQLSQKVTYQFYKVK